MPREPRTQTDFYNCIKNGVKLRKPLIEKFVKSSDGYNIYLRLRELERKVKVDRFNARMPEFIRLMDSGDILKEENL